MFTAGCGISAKARQAARLSSITDRAAVRFPNIMETAAEELRERYSHHTPRPEDTIRELLACTGNK